MKKSKRKDKNNIFILSPLALALSTMLSHSAYAEQSNKKDDIEVIEVKATLGILGSLREAQSIKRQSDNVVDAIVAEDIGKFPDDNVAEALQRIPGISVTRTDGAGQKVTIRGMSGKYNITTFNGRKLATDSENRDFNYDVIASELVGKIEVYKTQQAKLQEGAVGGVVNIYSRKPLDLGEELSLSVKNEYNARAKSHNPKTSFLVSDVFLDDTFGVLASLVHTKRVSRYDKYNSTNWDDWQYHELYSTANPNSEQEDVVTPNNANINDTFRMPRWPRITQTESERERLGGTLALQWLPNDDLDVNFDVLFSSYDVDNKAKAMTLVLPAYDGAAKITEFNVGPDGFVDNISWNNATVELLETGVPRKSDTYQVGLNTNWVLDDITLNFDMSVSGAKNEDDGNGSLVVVRAGVSGATINFNGNHPIPDMTLAQALDENAVYGAHHSRKFGNTVDDKTARFVIDGTWEPLTGTMSALFFGLGYNSQNKEKYNFYPSSPSIFAFDHSDEVNPTFTAPTVNIGGNTMWQLPHNVISPGTGNGFGGGANVPQVWPSINQSALFAYFNKLDPNAAKSLVPQSSENGDTYGVKEETLHAYIESKFEDNMFGLPYMLDIGVRYIKTDITSFSYSRNPANLVFNDDGTVANSDWKKRDLQQFEDSYSDVLPSVNLKLNLSEELVLRFAAAKAISRPFLSQLIPNTKIDPELEDVNDDKERRTIKYNNPGLTPYSSKQFDTALEWYYSENGNLSFASYFKQFAGFVKDNEFEETIAGNSFLATREINDDRHSLIRGYEISWFQTFDEFLPEQFAGFGISANYTLNNSTSGESDSEGKEIPFFGLSKHQSNVNLFYEQNGLSMNIAYNKRSSYSVKKVSHWTYETGGSVDTEQAVAPSWGNLSVGMSYDITDNLRVTADAYNLLDPDETLTVNALKTELLTAGASEGSYIFENASYGKSYSVGLRYKF
ncbi:TonB-dependent receptor [Pseudoalteromonas sp. MMG013]|uniref:TonB-dependent receptor n=1 Tax=Pseudoalteromonas sp. MMG013 TaxID=2822687 RepID=UPI001B360FD7|nr:TonB-dependent receptor [Pseudoalteromonas sp. MMG013]MBQ4860365.1 TonB-dependent receptor [Pseudoalteromonas sp. MMG013]